jgi:hypothetical protein
MRRAVFRRACNVSLDFAEKRDEIARLLEAYRGAVNFYIRSIWRHRAAKRSAAFATGVPDCNLSVRTKPSNRRWPSSTARGKQ